MQSCHSRFNCSDADKRRQPREFDSVATANPQPLAGPDPGGKRKVGYTVSVVGGIFDPGFAQYKFRRQLTRCTTQVLQDNLGQRFFIKTSTVTLD